MTTVYAAAWRFPSKAKRSVGGWAYHQASASFPSREEALKDLGREKTLGDHGGEPLWYKGTEFFIAEIEVPS